MKSIEIMRTEEDKCISKKPCQETAEAAATWRRQQPRPQEQHQQKLLEAHFFSREGRVLGACLNTFERSESSCECLTSVMPRSDGPWSWRNYTSVSSPTLALGPRGWVFYMARSAYKRLPDSCGTLTLHEQLAVV